MQHQVRTDKLVVIDLETTCSNDKAEQFQNEIIEIGMSILNMKTLLVEQNVSIMVKPQRSQVTAFCTKLTGIKPEDVEDGMLLNEACDVLIKDFDTQNYLWSSWGDFDRLMINRECKFYKANFPFNRQHLNLKADFALFYGLDELYGLDRAVKHAGIQFIGQHHRGVDDARTTAQLKIQMMQKVRS
jgi:inhibitor of KinA sporulation pathway (predicted exonuclease)